MSSLAGGCAQVVTHVLAFAFLVVLLSVALTTWVLLYVFNLRQRGWQWAHGALFSAMLGSTDCVAVAALLKSGAPRPWQPDPAAPWRGGQGCQWAHWAARCSGQPCSSGGRPASAAQQGTS